MLHHCIRFVPLLAAVWIIMTDNWHTSVQILILTNEVQDLRSRLQNSERMMQLTSELLELRARNMESCPEYGRLQQVEKQAEEIMRQVARKETDMIFLIEVQETLMSMRMQAHEQRTNMRIEACERKIAQAEHTTPTEVENTMPVESHMDNTKKALVVYRPKTKQASKSSLTTREWVGIAVVCIVSAYIGAQAR